MEFSEKLQELRKQKGLTQEELAAALYVSRTAISKWESGRGYPNIDSLKALAKFFSVTVDDLLSGEQVLTIAEAEQKKQETCLCDLVFGLLNLSAAMFLFLPFFGEGTHGVVQHTSLLALTVVADYLKISYIACVGVLLLWGVLTLALQNWDHRLWLTLKHKISLIINAFGVCLFVLGRQPYPAILLFVYLIIQVSLLMKKR